MSGFEVCIGVADLSASVRFYAALGFSPSDETVSGTVVMAFGDFHIALYQKPADTPLIIFRGGNVQRIADRAKSKGLIFEREPMLSSDGNVVALLRDPDGNAISFVSRS